MVSTGMLIYKEQGQRTNYFYIIRNLFIAFLAFSSCSKIEENDIKDISTQELNIINYKLKDYMFMKRHFDDQDRLWAFLQELASLHYDSYPLVASGGTLWSVKRDDISSWLQAKEKSEAVFRKLCSDPQLTLEANKWKVIFNVFKRDGGVDKWQVLCEHYPEKRYNQIEKIKISTLKPKGTFFCPLMG
ncbi:MAG TPA: hypothetical protein VMW72_14930 [Sedimentisphaerales bacterium]|nr:hypothetical protein [Sedimentisphaerales bacterium]